MPGRRTGCSLHAWQARRLLSAGHAGAQAAVHALEGPGMHVPKPAMFMRLLVRGGQAPTPALCPSPAGVDARPCCGCREEPAALGGSGRDAAIARGGPGDLREFLDRRKVWGRRGAGGGRGGGGGAGGPAGATAHGVPPPPPPPPPRAATAAPPRPAPPDRLAPALLPRLDALPTAAHALWPPNSALRSRRARAGARPAGQAPQPQPRAGGRPRPGPARRPPRLARALAAPARGGRAQLAC
jgi:hypothetical protein